MYIYRHAGGPEAAASQVVPGRTGRIDDRVRPVSDKSGRALGRCQIPPAVMLIVVPAGLKLIVGIVMAPSGPTATEPEAPPAVQFTVVPAAGLKLCRRRTVIDDAPVPTTVTVNCVEDSVRLLQDRSVCREPVGLDGSEPPPVKTTYGAFNR